MPKIVDKKLMRENIMRSSVDCFLEFGFNDTTMDMIAKNAGIAKGTLYIYFSSKQELISVITDQHFALLKQFLTSEVLFETLDELLDHIRNNLLMNKKEAEFIKIFFDAFGAQLSHKDFTDKYSQFFNDVGLFFRHNFELLIKNGEIDESINASTLSRVFVSMLDGIIIHKGFLIFLMTNI